MSCAPSPEAVCSKTLWTPDAETGGAKIAGVDEDDRGPRTDIRRPLEAPTGSGRQHKGLRPLSAARTLIAAAFATLLIHDADAKQFGLFTYSSLSSSEVAITDYPTDTVGHVDIPAMIEGKHVTRIDDEAFLGCAGLTGVTIPDSVTRIDQQAFRSCSGLTHVAIPDSVLSIRGGAFDSCSNLRTITLPSGLDTIEAATFLNCGSLTRITLPERVTSIEDIAFSGCTSLTSITIPEHVTAIEDFAFFGCTSLSAVIFLGDAPWFLKGVRCAEGRQDLVDCPAFGAFPPDNSPPFLLLPNLTFYHLAGSKGFDSPTWRGYPAVTLEAPPNPTGTWLLGHRYPLDTDLGQDDNGDGVSLLAAYALDLDPREMLPGHLPVPVIDDENLTMTFYGNAPGITYRVETSTNLRDWITEGVVLTSPGPDGRRTGIVPRDSAQRFLRLVVE